MCKGLAESLLISVEKKRIYRCEEFEQLQAQHHAMVSSGTKGRCQV